MPKKKGREKVSKGQVRVISGTGQVNTRGYKVVK